MAKLGKKTSSKKTGKSNISPPNTKKNAGKMHRLGKVPSRGDGTVFREGIKYQGQTNNTRFLFKGKSITKKYSLASALMPNSPPKNETTRVQPVKPHTLMQAVKIRSWFQLLVGMTEFFEFRPGNINYQVVQAVVAFLSPNWRSLNHPKKVTLNHQVYRV